VAKCRDTASAAQLRLEVAVGGSAFLRRTCLVSSNRAMRLAGRGLALKQRGTRVVRSWAMCQRRGTRSFFGGQCVPPAGIAFQPPAWR